MGGVLKRLAILVVFAVALSPMALLLPTAVSADAACYGPNTLLANWPGATLGAGLLTYPLCNSSGQLTTNASGGGGGGGSVAPLPGSGNTAAGANQSIGIQAFDGTSNMVPLQETGGALKVTGSFTSGAPLPGNTPTPTSSSGQAVGIAAVVGANFVPLTGTGTSLNVNVTGGSIANTAFGISGTLPAGTNTIGSVNLTGTFPEAYTPGTGSTGALGALGDMIEAQLANTTTLNSALTTISTNIAKNTYTSGALQVDCTTGCGSGGGGAVSWPYSYNQGDNQPINQATPTAGNNGNAIGIMAYDSTGNNVDRLTDTTGALNTYVTGGTIGLGAGSSAIGTVGLTSGSIGTGVGTPLYVSCVGGTCSGGGGGGGSATPSSWTLAITSNANQYICPTTAGNHANGSITANGTQCTIVSITVGCTVSTSSTCTGALAQNNFGAIYDTNALGASCISSVSAPCEIYSFGAMGGSAGFQTVEPWGPNGYQTQVGSGVIQMSASVPPNVAMYISGHTP